MVFSLGLRFRIPAALALIVAIVAPSARASAELQTVVGTTMVTRYAVALGTANTRLSFAARRDLAERLLLLSSYYKIDPSLLAALVTVESAWRAHAVSPVGALGYGQLMPGTASGLHVDAMEPYENLDGTARYLRRMLNRYAGRDELTRMEYALASYNAGAGAVDRYHGVPPYRETQNYVTNVLRTRRTFTLAAASRANDAVALTSTSTIPVRSQAVAVPRSDRAVLAAQLRLRHVRLARASFAARPYHAPVMDAAAWTSSTTGPAVRYERSRSFVARLFGLKHRVVATPAAAPSPAMVSSRN